VFFKQTHVIKYKQKSTNATQTSNVCFIIIIINS